MICFWPSGVAISMDSSDVRYWLEKSRFSGGPGPGLHAGGLFAFMSDYGGSWVRVSLFHAYEYSRILISDVSHLFILSIVIISTDSRLLENGLECPHTLTIGFADLLELVGTAALTKSQRTCPLCKTHPNLSEEEKGPKGSMKAFAICFCFVYFSSLPFTSFFIASLI
jgi:hypothetical protein